jgi:hypothetical protein
MATVSGYLAEVTYDGKSTVSRTSFAPHRHIAFYDAADFSVKLDAMFNPQEHSRGLSAEYGQLSPIGWSSDHHQYARSRDEPFELQLWYARFWHALMHKGVNYQQFEDPIKFFNAFTLGSEPGRAPRRCLVRWPNGFNAICVVTSATANHTRFNAELESVEYTLTVNFQPVANAFRSSQDMRKLGMMSVDRTYLAGGRGRGPSTGKPLRTAPKRRWRG